MTAIQEQINVLRSELNELEKLLPGWNDDSRSQPGRYNCIDLIQARKPWRQTTE